MNKYSFIKETMNCSAAVTGYESLPGKPVDLITKLKIQKKHGHKKNRSRTKSLD